MMIKNRTSRLPHAWLVAACVATGCGDARKAPVDLTPPELEPSRAALVASLDAWKAGRRTSGVLIGSEPAIGVVDSMRTFRPLLEFEVVGPLMVVDKARPFAVRLVVDSPRETIATRYLVLGRDPLWIYRQDDFERMLHWEHAMDPGPVEDPADPPAIEK